MDWYYANGAQQTGPVSDNEISRLAAEGVIAPSAMVWHARLVGWQTWGSLASGSWTSPASTFVYGGFWHRWLAYAIDAGIIGTIRAIAAAGVPALRETVLLPLVYCPCE